MMEYKVLTLWQPWATLLVHGIKKIETRPGPTNWTSEKGIYLIHAAKKWTREQDRICQSKPFKDAIIKHELEFDLGCIIGSVEIYKCEQIKDYSFIYNHVSNNEKAFGNYIYGRWAWLCQDFKVLVDPIPYVGGQGYYQNFRGDHSRLIFK